MEKNINTKKEDKKNIIIQFIKEHIISKTKVLSIIGIVFVILLLCCYVVSDVKMIDENTIFEKTSILSVLKERIVILLLIILAGWVPYFYIPTFTYIAYVFMLSGDLLYNMESNGMIMTLVINILPILMDVVTTAIIAAIGIYMCKCTTKKHKYTQRTSFSFLDVKMQLYQMTKKQDKYEEVAKKKEERIQEMQKNDVKIDYSAVFKIASVAIIINLVVCLIQTIIN